MRQAKMGIAGNQVFIFSAFSFKRANTLPRVKR